MRLKRAVPAMPSTSAGSQMWPEQIEHPAPAPRRVDVVGREQAGDADVEIGEGDPHQDQRQHEVGRGHADIVDHRQHVIAERARMGRRVDAGRHRQHPGQHEGEEGERHGEPELLADQLGIGPLVLERQAEVAVQQMLRPTGSTARGTAGRVRTCGASPRSARPRSTSPTRRASPHRPSGSLPAAPG